MAQKRKLDYYDDDFDFDTESLSSFESDEDFVHSISSSEDGTSDEENFSSVRQWCKIDSSSPAPSRFSVTGDVTLQDALIICYKQSPDNAHSVAFSQRFSPRLIEDETFNNSDIINNLIYYEDGQEELDSLRADKNMHRDPAFQQIGKAFSLNRYQLRKEYKIPHKKGLQSCITGYRNIYNQLTIQPSSQKLISMLPKNKSIEIVPSSDESDFELIHYRALNYDEYQ
ncbi:uncharacterized protein TNCV_1957181 [Trichonephila clavipes]|nr:uncharacterized protein TNCV_1957181 [Trichonephila clavipes]